MAATNPRIAIPAPADARLAHLAWPKAIRLADGTIVLAYLAGSFHGNHSGKSPAVSLSRDEGRTFTPPHVLKKFSPGDALTASGNLSIGIARDGAVVLLAMGYRGDEANDIFGWRSTDGARSWTPVDTSALGPNKTGSVCGRIENLPDGRLITVGHYRKGAKPFDTGIWHSASADDGRTWSPPQMINNLNAGEPVIVRSGSRLLVFIRGRGPASTRQFVSVSDDWGRTWRTDLLNITPVNARTTGFTHPFAMVDPRDPAGIVALSFERPLPSAVALWRGDSAKFTFKRESQLLELPKIDGNPNTDFGYPWLVPTREAGRYLMFYYHGRSRGASAIWVADVTL